MNWIIDGNNVMGSRPDGWWNDRPAAMERLAQQVAEWCWTHTDHVTLVFDGSTIDDVASMSGGNLRVVFAERSARDAADDVIAERAAKAQAPVRVVTADKGLRGRLPERAITEGPSAFLQRIT